MGGQPPARGSDSAHEALASGPPPCWAITLQSGQRNPSQTNSGFMSEITRRPYTRWTASFTKRLCAPSLPTSAVMSAVVKVVNSILSRSLNHRQFQALVDEVDVQYGDLLYFCEVHWLSRGTMLSRVCDLQ